MLGISTVPGHVEQNPPPHSYEYGPFLFESQIAIPELKGVRGVGDPIVVNIRLGQVPDEIDGAAPYGKLCRVAKSAYLLKIPQVARFLVQNGVDVTVQLEDDAPPADVSTYLLGSVFGALCHQNGLLPLHASAVRTHDGVTAFLGDSGAGKSTLAACLQGRGYGIVSDDICTLEEDADSTGMRVIPVAGWLKLWRTSLNHLGETPDERNRVYSADDKYRLYLEAHAGERPVLRNLVFLEKAAQTGVEPNLEPLSTAETIGLMMKLTYLGYITELTGSHARVFRQCGRVLAQAKGYRLTMPWGFAEMEKVLQLVERELLRRGL
jgi:hypothetical protein